MAANVSRALDELELLLESKEKTMARMRLQARAQPHELRLEEMQRFRQAVAMQQALAEQQPDAIGALRPLMERIAVLQSAARARNEAAATGEDASADAWETLVTACSSLPLELDVEPTLERVEAIWQAHNPSGDAESVAAEEQREAAELQRQKREALRDLEKLKSDQVSEAAKMAQAAKEAIAATNAAVAAASAEAASLREAKAKLEEEAKTLKAKLNVA